MPLYHVRRLDQVHHGTDNHPIIKYRPRLITLVKEEVYKCYFDYLIFSFPWPERGRPLVAGCVGAYGAFLLDGSEYSGGYAEAMSIEVSKL